MLQKRLSSPLHDSPTLRLQSTLGDYNVMPFFYTDETEGPAFRVNVNESRTVRVDDDLWMLFQNIEGNEHQGDSRFV